MGQESLTTEYLCDVLYADRIKLSSYLTQIDPQGVITGYKSSMTETDASKIHLKSSLAIASGEYSTDRGNQELAERTFDPAAALPIEVMNKLYEHGYIHADAHDAPIGSLILLDGKLSLLDLSGVVSTWPMLKKFLPFKDIVKDIPIIPANGKATVSDMETVFRSILESLPQPIQMKLSSSGYEYWSTLAETNFTSSPIDLFMKHPKEIAGNWKVLGIYDCEDGETGKSGGDADDFASSIHEMMQSFRAMFGKPERARGISPLMIFRTIKKGAGKAT